MSSFSFVSTAPGKIILAGEHAVVHGATALATVIAKRTYIKFQSLPVENNNNDDATINFKINHVHIQKVYSWKVNDLKQIGNLFITGKL